MAIRLAGKKGRDGLDTSDDQRDGYSILIHCPVCEKQRWLQDRRR